MIIFKIVFVFMVLVLVWHFTTKKYLNPYKLIMIFGKKGCGKSTTICKLALQYRKKGWTVYSTERTPDSYYIEPSQIGYVRLKPHSVLLVDEVGMIWDNRDFKNFKKEVRDWFKLQRHAKIRVYLFSQTFDIDKKLRDLTDEMYLVTNVARVFSYGKKISKKIVINKSTADSPSNLSENLEFESLFWFWCGSRTLTFIPRYVKYFDSFKLQELKECEFEYIPSYVPVRENRIDREIIRRIKCGIERIISRTKKQK